MEGVTVEDANGPLAWQIANLKREALAKSQLEVKNKELYSSINSELPFATHPQGGDVGKRHRKRHSKLHKIGESVGWECVYCGVKLECSVCNPNTNSPATRDHVWPKIRGGTNILENLVLSCRPCNMEKGSNILRVCDWKLGCQEFAMIGEFYCAEHLAQIDPTFEF